MEQEAVDLLEHEIDQDLGARPPYQLAENGHRDAGPPEWVDEREGGGTGMRLQARTDTPRVGLFERHLVMNEQLDARRHHALLLEALDVDGERGSNGPIQFHEVKLVGHSDRPVQSAERRL